MSIFLNKPAPRAVRTWAEDPRIVEITAQLIALRNRRAELAAQIAAGGADTIDAAARRMLAGEHVDASQIGTDAVRLELAAVDRAMSMLQVKHGRVAILVAADIASTYGHGWRERVRTIVLMTAALAYAVEELFEFRGEIHRAAGLAVPLDMEQSPFLRALASNDAQPLQFVASAVRLGLVTQSEIADAREHHE
jgi:hypothetical protein